MCSSMPCSNVKKINETSLFVLWIIVTAVDGAESWSRLADYWKHVAYCSVIVVFCGRKICPFPQFAANFITFHEKS